ncbi:MAG: imidazole glycerol phosphate synthase subunit HisH [Bacteroidota bacterium]
MKIAIIDYGAGNIRSVQFALQRLGKEAIFTRDADQIRAADKVIFPGVGEASSAMGKLQESGLDKVIPTLTQPVLGICLGMQLMCRYSQENNTNGLGIFDTDVIRFKVSEKVPQIGWNRIYGLRSSLFDGIGEKEFMYLVHSYYVPAGEQSIALSTYGIEYATALHKDNFYGVQFHPEKSSKAGSRLLENFLTI